MSASFRLGLFSLLIAAGVSTGCGGDDGPRPTTVGEVCEQIGTIDCAVDARDDACASRPDEEAMCLTDYLAQCCSDAGGALGKCTDAVTASDYPTLDQYSDCHDAIKAQSCTDIEANVKPAACNGVVR